MNLKKYITWTNIFVVIVVIGILLFFIILSKFGGIYNQEYIEYNFKEINLKSNRTPDLNELEIHGKCLNYCTQEKGNLICNRDCMTELCNNDMNLCPGWVGIRSIT